MLGERLRRRVQDDSGKHTWRNPSPDHLESTPLGLETREEGSQKDTQVGESRADLAYTQ